MLGSWGRAYKHSLAAYTVCRNSAVLVSGLQNAAVTRGARYEPTHTQQRDGGLAIALIVSFGALARSLRTGVA